jgi:hypothetical protein
MASALALVMLEAISSESYRRRRPGVWVDADGTSARLQRYGAFFRMARPTAGTPLWQRVEALALLCQSLERTAFEQRSGVGAGRDFTTINSALLRISVTRHKLL